MESELFPVQRHCPSKMYQNTWLSSVVGISGLNWGLFWKRLGSRVTVLEMRPQIFPGMDGETALEAQRILHRQGLEFQFGKKVTSAMRNGDQCQIALEGGDTIECSHILVAVGRKPFLEGLGLDSIGVELDSEGKVQVSKGFETNIPGIYALGDLVTGPMLAHKAEEEAVAFAETLCGETPFRRLSTYSLGGLHPP